MIPEPILWAIGITAAVALICYGLILKQRRIADEIAAIKTETTIRKEG
jgi:hypothetical protein